MKFFFFLNKYLLKKKFLMDERKKFFMKGASYIGTMHFEVSNEEVEKMKKKTLVKRSKI
jgi:hypothetical protein